MSNIVYRVGKNREAGAEIHVIDNRDESFELHGGDREMFWVTFCDTHSSYCTHRTRALAEEFAHHPAQWCATCASEGTARAKQEQEHNAKDARLDLDRKVYTYVLLNWAVSAKDVLTGDLLAGTGAEAKDVNASLKRLENKGLLASEHINGERELTWQTMYDIENDPDAETNGQADFDAAHKVASK